MICMCGDTYCKSCGPAQGFHPETVPCNMCTRKIELLNGVPTDGVTLSSKEGNVVIHVCDDCMMVLGY